MVASMKITTLLNIPGQSYSVTLINVFVLMRICELNILPKLLA
jgi:hypothetical protein